MHTTTLKKTSSKLKKLTKILSDGECHSGSSLGAALKITRSAVWKLINQLQAYGIPIQANKAKGYVMTQPLILLDKSLIKKSMLNPIAREQFIIEVFSSVPSTNDYFKNKALSDHSNIYACLAEQQTAGKGRLGRSWYSPFGTNVYLSCCKIYDKDISELAGLSLVIGLAIINAIEKLGLQEDVKIKWPNDIYYRDKKIAGVLLEAVAESYGSSKVIVGIGLNANMTSIEDSAMPLEKAWLSLAAILNHYQDRNKIVGTMLDEIYDYLTVFDNRGLAVFLAKWQQYDFLNNKPITLLNINQTINGIARGINEYGHLRLEMNDGNIKTFASGDTTIKRLR